MKSASLYEKKKSEKNYITLDTKHKEYLDEFATNEAVVLPQLKKKIIELSQLLSTTQNIDKYLEICDEIDAIKSRIKEIKQKKKKYMLDNSELIFDYFENKKTISSGNDNKINTNKSKIFNTFFKIPQEPTSAPAVDVKKNTCDIIQKYLRNINNDSYIKFDPFIQPTDICKRCHVGELSANEDEGLLICKKCYISTPYLIEHDKSSYKDPPKEVCFYAYKRINHFKEILAQFQGKETTQIHPDVIEKIKLQIKKERYKLSELTNAKTKEILRKLGHNKYYEHIPFIKDKIGISPPIMSPELEETLCNLFIEIQAPYSKFCPEDRVNFLNYYYTLYKLCELLGETQYLPDIPMLKDRDKRIEQDEIWKKICTILGWDFIPTL
jgi:hypothetical protein